MSNLGTQYKKGDRIILKIENLAFGGPGVARVENGVDAEGVERRLVVFVENVAPGDEVEVDIFEIKRSLARGRVVRFVKFSAERVEARCQHFGIPLSEDGRVITYSVDGGLNLAVNCGGCSWQFLPYEKQLLAKEEEVRSSLVRIGGISGEALAAVWKPIMAAENPWFYRNKMDFSIVRDKKTGLLHFGLHMKGRYWEVTEVKECFLFRPWLRGFLEPMREFLTKLELNEGGELMSLIVRSGTNTGEVMVNLQVENAETLPWAGEFLKLLRGLDYGEDKLVSVYLTEIANRKGQRKKFEEKLLWGAPVFLEKLRLDDGRELKFEVAPQAFLQPNTRQAERFYSLVGALAELSGKETVFDLFCGAGTIGLTLAAGAGRVVGVELNASAIENARENAEINGVSNVEFLVGDATKILPEMAAATIIAARRESQGASVDVLVVDPPRAGLNPEIIGTISATAARRVIYVSCNPTTLARDLKEFLKLGWKLDFVQAIDQFSQTYHVETVVRMTKVLLVED